MLDSPFFALVFVLINDIELLGHCLGGNVSSADNLCKQFGLKEFFEKDQHMTKMHEKLPRQQRVES